MEESALEKGISIGSSSAQGSAGASREKAQAPEKGGQGKMKEKLTPIGISPQEALKRMEEKGPIRGGQDAEPVPPGLSPEQVAAWRQAREALGDLITPPEEGEEAPLADEILVRLAQAAAMSHNQSRARIEGLLDKGDDFFAKGQVGAEEWAMLGGALRGLADVFPPPEREGLFREYEYDTQVSAELDMRPVQPPFDTSWPPAYFTSSAEARRYGLELGDWQRLLRARTQLANACALKHEKKDTDLVATKDNPLFNLKREELRLMYEMPGVKQSLWRFFNELFVGEKVNGRFRLRLRPARAGDPGANEKLKDVEALKRKIWSGEGENSILRDGFVENEVDARAAVAVAWNLIFIGHTVESADLNREVNPCPAYGEQPRALCHPLAKARARYLPKTDGEFDPDKVRPWGGQRFGNWLKERVTKDPRFRRGLEEGTIRPFPESMCVSLLEYIKIDDRGTMLAEKLLNQDDEGIDWNNVSQETAGDYKDFMDTATAGYTFATGLNMIDFKDPRTRQEWTTKLGDVIGKMRPKILGVEYDSDDFLVWSICASVGLNFETSDLFLNVPEGAPYGAVLDSLLDPILVNEKEKKKRIKIRLLEKNIFSGPMRAIKDFQRSWRKGG